MPYGYNTKSRRRGRRGGQVHRLRRARKAQRGQPLGTNGLAARKAVIGHSGAQRGQNKRYQRIITSALNSVRGKTFRFGSSVVLSTGSPFHIEGSFVAIPEYMPTAVAPNNIPNATRSTNRVFVKGFNLRVALTSLLSRRGAVRLLMFANTAPSEIYDSVASGNLFENAAASDAGPVHSWAGGMVQKFNWDLVMKKSDLLMDRTYKLSTTIAGDQNSNVLQNCQQYVPFNRIVRYETDQTNPSSPQSIPKFFVYLVAIAMAETGFSSVGTIDYQYSIDTYFTEDA